MGAVWCYFFGAIARSERLILRALEEAGVSICQVTCPISGPGLAVFSEPTEEVYRFLLFATSAADARVLAVIVPGSTLSAEDSRCLLLAGATDVLHWNELGDPARSVAERLERWREIDALIESPSFREQVVGRSRSWLRTLRRVVELARYGDFPILLTGETGTGKGLLARIVHELSVKAKDGPWVELDAATMPPELSASELFGHEQGAFTGASKRRSPFEDAEGGTVFLDEVGDLQPITQGQLLRVIDEKRVKRLGSNTWQDANFRLVCATRMDLASMATEGRFRRDLYHRLAGHVVHLPPLRDRPEDVLPLVRHFLQKNSGTGKAPALDPRVESYLEERSYPGNVRELRDVTLEILARHAGSGPISMGAVPAAGLCDREFSGSSGDALEGACRRAISLGLSLQAIGRWAEDCALRLLLAENGGSIKKVAAKLNLTRRSLEKRRAAWRRNGQR